MQKYIDQILPVLDWLLRDPASGLERWVTLGVAVLVGALALWGVGRALRLRNTEFWRYLLVVLLVWAVAIAATAVAMVHMPGSPLIWVVTAVSVLVVGVVMMFLLMRANIWGALIPLCISLAAMVGAVMLAQAAFQSFGAGKRQTGGIREHKQYLQDVIKN